jgi:hypothetical protein
VGELAQGANLYHLDVRFWILDWEMPDQLSVSQIKIMQAKNKMALFVKKLRIFPVLIERFPII